MVGIDHVTLPSVVHMTKHVTKRHRSRDQICSHCEFVVFMVVSSCPSANLIDRALRTWLLASLESLSLCFAQLFAPSG
jgi:hypothetical protein